MNIKVMAHLLIHKFSVSIVRIVNMVVILVPSLGTAWHFADHPKSHFSVSTTSVTCMCPSFLQLSRVVETATLCKQTMH